MSLDQHQNKLTLGATIRSRRLELRLSQQEIVADNYSEAYLSRVEHDQIQPSKDFLQFLASRLNTTPTQLLADSLPKKPKISRAVRAAQELELMNAHVALQSSQFQSARLFLQRLDLPQLPSELLARYYAMMGEADSGLRKYEEALSFLNKALNELKFNPKIAPIEVERVRNLIGLVYYNQGKYHLAIEQHNVCLNAINSGSIRDAYFTMTIYRNLANELHLVGSNHEALELYKKAAVLAEDDENSEALAAIYWGIGLVSLAEGDSLNARLYLDKSATLYEQAHQPKMACQVKGNLGKVLIERSEYQQAEVILSSALALAQEAKDEQALLNNYVNLAYLYKMQGKLEEARAKAVAGIERGRALGNKFLLGQALAQQAEIELAFKTPHEIEYGLKLYAEAVANLEQTDASNYLSEVCFHYANALESNGKVVDSIQLYLKAYKYKKVKEVYR